MTDSSEHVLFVCLFIYLHVCTLSISLSLSLFRYLSIALRVVYVKFQLFENGFPSIFMLRYKQYTQITALLNEKIALSLIVVSLFRTFYPCDYISECARTFQ